MSDNTKNSAILLLEDGTVFHGRAAGKIGTSSGEICFNTGMTGYQEIFTDPSYFGQMMVMTNVHIGNYGAKHSDTESDSIKINGLICKHFNVPHSRQLADQNLQDYFEDQGLVGISGVDTRAIVRHIRSKGAMNCIVSSEVLEMDQLRKLLEQTPSMDGLELASQVSTKEAYTFGNPDAPLRVAALDYGIKQHILHCMSDRNIFVKVFPAKTAIEDLEAFQPNGYFISNGPGDPAAMGYAVDTTRKLIELGKPLFGICLGHQLLALAADIPTFKMHHGHRGINHPVKNLITGRCEITSQNHGFGVSQEAIEAAGERVEVTHVNLNDQSIEGLRIKNKPAFSVQYHPEASPGPHDARYLFDHFLELMKN